jgi:hypothetical protein
MIRIPSDIYQLNISHEEEEQFNPPPQVQSKPVNHSLQIKVAVQIIHEHQSEQICKLLS